MRNHSVVIALLACAAPVLVAPLGAPLAAQEALLPSTGGGVGMALSGWHFSTPLPQSSGKLVDIAEFAIPFRVRTVFGRWSLDLSGAGAVGAVHFTPSAGQQKQNDQTEGDDRFGERLVTIYGPTDLKLRMTGPVIGDNTLVTVGLNLPTGKVGLNADETSALQAIGAPAVGMPVGAFGTGAGATFGLIRAFQGDEWAVAVGGSIEQRTEYSPIALLLSSGTAKTNVTPGTAAHVTLGFDRPLGENRLSALLVGDVFSKDLVRLDDGSGTESRSDFTLGPQVTATTRIDLAASRWRESALNVAVRMRSAFSDASGSKVSGSAGTYLEASIGGVRGGADGTGLVVAADARWHSGLEFTDALVGAAVTAVGMTVGWDTQRARSATRFVLHAQFGTFDTGSATTTGFGGSLGFSIGARREAR
jgi:hypothetical protein